VGREPAVSLAGPICRSEHSVIEPVFASRISVSTVCAVLLACAWPPTVTSQDVPRGTLIASNMNDHTASLIDAGTGRAIATLPTGKGPHEVAVSHDGRWALVSNYGIKGEPGNSLTVIDVARHAVARTISLGEHLRPHGIAFFPGDSMFAVTSETDRAVLIVDFRDGGVRDVLPTNGRATHMLGLSASGQQMVTANIADATISYVEPVGQRTPRLISVARQPEGIAIAPDGRTAWVGSNRDSVVMVVPLGAAQPTDTLRGFGLPYRMAMTPDGKTVVITDPAKAEIKIFDAIRKQLTITISVPRDSVLATAEIPGSPSPEGVVVSTDSRWAFVTLQGRNRVVTIDLRRGLIVAYAVTGNWSDGIGYSPLR
jgi:DNA-binding beta-propeller fold protein YncE